MQSVIDQKTNYFKYFLYKLILTVSIILFIHFAQKYDSNENNEKVVFNKEYKRQNLVFKVIMEQRPVEIENDDIIEIYKKKKKKKKKKIIKKKREIIIPDETSNQKPLINLKFKENYITRVYRKLSKNKYYPEIEQEMGHTGVINVKFIIQSNGTIKKLEIVKKCRYRRLNQAALTTIKESIPFPRLEDGLNELAVNINIVYKLN